MLIKSVKNTISRYGLLEDGDKILVGVSGGHDSVTLFHILNEISREKNYSLHIAHINHGIRGVESDGDEDYVRDMAKRYGVPFYSKKVDMNLYAKERGLSSEEAGREIRYAFFKEVIEAELKGGKIAVAHNKNDQAETVLMRMMRGTGIDGLKGMDFVNGVIVRPLLNISRSQIEDYCESSGIAPRIDKTNFENIYSRNKVRLELIPYIESNFNPNLIDTVCRMSDILRNDADYLETISEKSYRDIVLCEKPNAIFLDNSRFKTLDAPIRNRVARKAVLSLLGTLEGLEEKHIRLLVEFSDESKTGKSIDLLKEVVAKISYDKLSLEKSEKKVGISYNYRVEVGEMLELKEVGGYIKSGVYDIEGVDTSDKAPYKRFFDYDSVECEVRVRSRLTGDKVQLMGMSGRKKLKDYYIDEKIPREDRTKIPIVEIDGEIVWIVGYRVAEKAQITPSTKRVLVLEYLKNK